MQKTFVTLIRPSYVTPLKMMHSTRGILPIGLAYVAGSLKQEGHQVDCIDGLGEAFDQITPFEDSNFVVNGLTNELFSEFSNLIKEIKKDHNVSGLILKSSLPNTFSAGLDLKYVQIGKNENKNEAEKRLKLYFRNFSKMIKELANFPHPVVSLIGGFAPAGNVLKILNN